MNLEAKVINAVCVNHDINTLFSGGADDLFVTHKDIWDYVKNYYYRHGGIPSADTIAEKFRDFEVEAVKGPTAAHLDELRDNFIKSKIRSMMVDKASKLNDLSGEDILGQLFSELSSLGRLSTRVRDIDLVDWKSAEQHYKDQADLARQRGGTPGIPTGFKAIDSCYPTGLAGGHMAVLIGWPGKAKTWFSSLMATRAWDAGYKPMIVSLEMSPEGMRDRLYTLMAAGQFRNSEFSKGLVNLDDFSSWSRRRFDNKPGFIVVSSEGSDSVTPMTVQAKIDQHRPDLVICDYHQLFEDNKRSKNEVERNRNVSRELKLLAVHNNIPVVDITAATMDDISDRNNPPMLSQVAWSKAIEYDADIAMAVHKHDDSNLVEIVGRKNRHGSEFAFYLDWDIDAGIVKDLSGDE